MRRVTDKLEEARSERSTHSRAKCVSGFDARTFSDKTARERSYRMLRTVLTSLVMTWLAKVPRPKWIVAASFG